VTGTTITLPNAVIPRANVLMSLWAPDELAPLLADEFVLGGTAEASLLNRSAGNSGTLIGAPTITARTLDVVAPASAGFDCGAAAVEVDQTFVIVCANGGGGGIFAAAGFLGILGGVNGDPWAFYNGHSGVAPNAATTPYLGAGFQFVIGWGSSGDVGRICSGKDGALTGTVTGKASGGPRDGAPLKIGGSIYPGNGFKLAYAARCPAILTPAQRLGWYQALRGDGTAASSPLGIAIL
jgi:hypothetical protein